jgi:hypothetical protein
MQGQNNIDCKNKNYKERLMDMKCSNCGENNELEQGKVFDWTFGDTSTGQIKASYNKGSMCVVMAKKHTFYDGTTIEEGEVLPMEWEKEDFFVVDENGEIVGFAD